MHHAENIPQWYTLHDRTIHHFTCNSPTIQSPERGVAVRFSVAYRSLVTKHWFIYFFILCFREVKKSSLEENRSAAQPHDWMMSETKPSVALPQVLNARAVRTASGFEHKPNLSMSISKSKDKREAEKDHTNGIYHNLPTFEMLQSSISPRQAPRKVVMIDETKEVVPIKRRRWEMMFVMFADLKSSEVAVPSCCILGRDRMLSSIRRQSNSSRSSQRAENSPLQIARTNSRGSS